MSDKEFCPTTGKVKFFSRSVAFRDAQNRGRSKGHKSAKVLVYPCPDCQGFHQTNASRDRRLKLGLEAKGSMR
jgi:hypothetical protein